MKTPAIPMSRKIRKAMLLLAAALMGLPASAQNAPLAFESASPIVDEFGQTLPGTADGGGALVQLLAAPNGIYPPDVDGQPHPSNAMLAVTHIGAGTDPSMVNAGLVSGALILKRAEATKLFARVFNRESLAASSFYGDSAVYTNPTTAYGMFLFDVAATTNALDTNDLDEDGLNSSWEKSLGSDQNNPDTDGDGMPDGAERLAGTGMLDPDSNLAMVRLLPQASGELLVQWDSVPGKKYVLQYAPLHVAGSEFAFSNISAIVTASSNVMGSVVAEPDPGPLGVFRVRVVTE